MANREGFYTRWNMAHESELWVHPRTLENMNTIYDFIEADTERLKDRVHTPEFSYTRISNQTSVPIQSVRSAVHILAFQRDPILRVRARSFRTKKGGKIVHKVSLIRKAETTRVDGGQ